MRESNATAIEAWEKKAGVKISSGDAIFLRTGRWARREKVGPWESHQTSENVRGNHRPEIAIPLNHARDVGEIFLPFARAPLGVLHGPDFSLEDVFDGGHRQQYSKNLPIASACDDFEPVTARKTAPANSSGPPSPPSKRLALASMVWPDYRCAADVAYPRLRSRLW